MIVEQYFRCVSFLLHKKYTKTCKNLLRHTRSPHHCSIPWAYYKTSDPATNKQTIRKYTKSSSETPSVGIPRVRNGHLQELLPGSSTCPNSWLCGGRFLQFVLNSLWGVYCVLIDANTYGFRTVPSFFVGPFGHKFPTHKKNSFAEPDSDGREEVGHPSFKRHLKKNIKKTLAMPLLAFLFWWNPLSVSHWF